MAGLRVAVAGATGLVGRTILQVLEEQALPLAKLIPLASQRSPVFITPTWRTFWPELPRSRKPKKTFGATR